MLWRRMAHQLQKIEGSGEVRVEIGARIFEAVTHARLRREMIDRIEPRAIDLGQAGEILEQHLMAAKALILFENRVAAALQLGVVIGGEAVDPDDLMAIGEKPRGHVETDESGAAGDENAHGVQGWRPGLAARRI